MSSAVAGHKRSFGECLQVMKILNIQIWWYWSDRMVPSCVVSADYAGKKPDMFVVVIDPRFTSTCEQAICRFYRVKMSLYLIAYSISKWSCRSGICRGLYRRSVLASSEPEANVEYVAKRTHSIKCNSSLRNLHRLKRSIFNGCESIKSGRK